MTLRTVLTMLEGSDTDTIDLAAAGRLASDHACHVDLLHVRRDPRTVMPMVGEGLSADLIDMVQNQVMAEEETLAQRCRDVFEQWVSANSLSIAASPTGDGKASARLLDVVGSSGEAVARYGKFADLVVLTAPSLDDGDLSPAAEAAIYDTGRPVLFSPRRELATLGERVSVFWNDTVEASRAAYAALPFLRTAKSVQVKSVDDGSFDPATIDEFAASLAWHGVAATTRVVQPDHRSAGEALLDAAWDFEADLVVMGAFSHSRLREMILGGVTKHILQVAGRPVLMMH